MERRESCVVVLAHPAKHRSCHPLQSKSYIDLALYCIKYCTFIVLHDGTLHAHGAMQNRAPDGTGRNDRRHSGSTGSHHGSGRGAAPGQSRGRARSRSAAHRTARGCEGSDRDDRLRVCHESIAGGNAAITKGRPEHARTLRTREGWPTARHLRTCALRVAGYVPGSGSTPTGKSRAGSGLDPGTDLVQRLQNRCFQKR